MTKSLKDILNGVKKSTVTPGSIGVDPGVDYEPKAGDEQKFVKKHSTEKHASRAGNKEDIFQATNVKYSMDDPKMKNFGHKKGEDEKVYGEETVNELGPNTLARYTQKAAGDIAQKAVTIGAKSRNIFGGSTEKEHKTIANRFAGITKATNKLSRMAKEETELKCNKSPKGTKCPVHGLAECGGMGYTKKTLKEVLTKKTSAGEVIKDFENSKDPKFAGKSKEERKRMALGAYYGMHPEKSKYTKEDLAIPLLGGDQSDLPKGRADDTQEEIEMVKAELKALANKSLHILTQMPHDLHVEPWVQAKIAQAKEMINSVHDYMVYGDHDKPEEDEQTSPSDGGISSVTMAPNSYGAPMSQFGDGRI